MAYAATALTYIGYAIIIGSAIYSIYMMSKGGGDIEDLAANNLDDFNITRAEEGSVAPLQYGRAKITGNLMWYGNFESVPIIEKVDSGKKSQNVVTGYNYYLDVWQALGHGKLTILRTWIDEEEKQPEYSSSIFNDGTQTTYPTEPGEWANAMPGVSTIFFKKLLLGENVTALPTIHWLTERLLTSAECPLDYRNITGAGVNPAAIVYDLLRRGGASTSDFNVSKFQAAATYWYNKGYGLNVIFNQRMEVREAIKTVLKYVGASFGRDKDNLFYLSALDENDSSAATLDYDSGDFISFNFERKAWDQCNTDFVGTYKDEDQDYTNRTVKAYNPAVARILRRTKPRGIDLKAFRTTALASERIWEIMKEDTYPYCSIQAEVPMRFHNLLMGNVVTVNHSKYGITGAEFRVMQKDYKDKDSNGISLLLRQNTEKLWDSNFRSAGGSAWVAPEYTPTTLYAQRVYQLPYNHITGSTLSYILLAARRNTYDLGYSLYRSLTGSDYTAVDIRRTFSQYGTLDVAYPANTIEIDEDIGITYTPYSEDPAFDTIGFVDAMQAPRLALLGDELVGFATVTLNGDGSITLTDCIRGMFGTQIETHAVSSSIWLFSIDSSIVYQDTAPSFYLKFVPYTLHGVMDIGSCSAINVTRSSSTLSNTDVLAPMVHWNRGGTVTVLPRYKDGYGAGFVGEDIIDVELPTNLPSNIKIFWRTSTNYSWNEETTYSFSYTDGYLDHFYIKIQIDGRESPTIYFDDADGYEQWFPAVPSDNTMLSKLFYGAEHWSSVMDTNAVIMENNLNLSDMVDVDASGVTADDRLMWNVDTQKFEVVSRDYFTLSVFDCTVLTLLKGAHGPYEDGSITASGYQPNYYPQHAWDGGLGSLYPQWISEYNTGWNPDTTWWQIDFAGSIIGEAKKIVCLQFKTRYNSTTDRWPSEVKVVVSDTGAFAGEETTVYDGEVPGASSLTPLSWSQWIHFTNPTKANFLRIYIQNVYTYDPGSSWVAVDQWQMMEEDEWNKVKSMALSSGIADDTHLVLKEDDSNVLTIEGIEATPAFDADFLYGDVVAPFYIRAVCKYTGDDSHIVRIKAYNYNTSTFDYITAVLTDFENREDEATYIFGPLGANYVDGSGNTKIKLVHESAGDSSDSIAINELVLLGTSTSTTTTTV